MAGGIAEWTVHPKSSLKQLLAEDMYILPSAALISRAAFEAVGGFDPQFMGYEDDDLFVRLFQAGFSNLFLPEAVTVWNINRASTSYSFRMTRSRMRYMLKLADAFPDNEATGELYLSEYIAPRFFKRILKDARHAQQPDHKFYPDRDEAFATARQCVDAMLSSPAMARRLRRRIWWYWQRVRWERYGLWGALSGRGD